MSFIVQSVKNVKHFIEIADMVKGKEIASMCIERIDEDTDVVRMSFTDNSYLSIYDDGQLPKRDIPPQTMICQWLLTGHLKI